MGGRESSCSKTDVSAILTICLGRFDLGRGTCERHVSPDGRHLDNRTDIYVQRLRPAGEADVYGRGRGDAHRTGGDEPDVRREREHSDRSGDGGVQREHDEDADVPVRPGQPPGDRTQYLLLDGRVDELISYGVLRILGGEIDMTRNEFIALLAENNIDAY